MEHEVIAHELPATANLNRPMTIGELTKQALLIQEILEKVMVGPTPENPGGVHYGIVPGTKKPTLLQPGAEKICATFRLAPKYTVEDLSEPHNNFYRYRIICSLFTINEGLFVGSACGEASSAEEKFSWERAICHEQWEMADPSRRRVKFKKKYNSDEIEQIEQVSTNAADLSNTVLKIACKRAYVSAARSSTAASDLLEVDLEEPAVQNLARQEQEEGKSAPSTSKPKARVNAPVLPYGEHKGKKLDDATIPLTNLEWFADTIAAAIKDETKKKFQAQNQVLLLALDVEIAKRTQIEGQTPSKPVQNPSADRAGATSNSGKVESQRAPFTDGAWVDFILIAESDMPEAYKAAKTKFKVTSGHDVISADARFSFFDFIGKQAVKK